MKKSWDKKWYSDEFLQKLKDGAYEEYDGNLKYTVKYPPDAISKTGIDPRMLGGPISKMAKLLRFVPDFIFNNIHTSVNSKNIEAFRKSCEICSYADCKIKSVDIENSHIKASDGYNIPIRIYKSKNKTNSNACLVFIHGGAFVAGSLAPYDEAMKMLVDKFELKVISIDYRPLPENPYPTLYNDCFDVIEYIYNNENEFEIDKNEIFVCGDSAGGNIAQACATHFAKTDIIKAQLLLYPTLNLFQIEDKYYKKGINGFTFEPKQKGLSKGVIRQMQTLAKCDVTKIRIKKPDKYNNPYSFDVLSDIPTFISVGALDFLKKDAFAWAHKLNDKGIDLKLVVYNGLGHGYINATGVFPQAEDLIDEMGEFIKNRL
ncbi:MAG: alpha/beta hydrolase [Eubacterium sp.]|nr:alpha/beta hydrolase [Eubacterium sp.]